MTRAQGHTRHKMDISVPAPRNAIDEKVIEVAREVAMHSVSYTPDQVEKTLRALFAEARHVPGGLVPPPIKQKHTPGPWKIMVESDLDGDYIDDLLFYVGVPPREMGQTGKHVALTMTWGAPAGRDPEAMANANLIAASPDLLAALRKVEAAVSKVSYGLGVDGRTADALTKLAAVLRLDAACCDARSALAAATGEGE